MHPSESELCWQSVLRWCKNITMCLCVCVFVYDLSISPCKTNFIIWHFNGWKLFPDLTCCSCWSNICSMLLNLLCLHNVLRAFLRHRTQGRKKDNKVLIYSIAIHECGHSEVVLSCYGLKTAGAFMQCCQALLVKFFYIAARIIETRAVKRNTSCTYSNSS